MAHKYGMMSLANTYSEQESGILMNGCEKVSGEMTWSMSAS